MVICGIGRRSSEACPKERKLRGPQFRSVLLFLHLAGCSQPFRRFFFANLSLRINPAFCSLVRACYVSRRCSCDAAIDEGSTNFELSFRVASTKLARLDRGSSRYRTRYEAWNRWSIDFPFARKEEKFDSLTVSRRIYKICPCPA